MGEHVLYERYHWFDRQVRDGRYPNATTLAGQSETSTKTAQRAIDYMRHRLRAPLVYDASRRGYYYSDDSFRLPALQVSQEELLAVLVARSLLRPDEEGPLAEAIRSLGEKLRTCLGGAQLTERRLDQILSAVAPGHAACSPHTFDAVLHAVLRSRLLTIDYRAASTGTVTRRTVEPHHLQHYLGSWVLLAWCRLKGEWRIFYVSRMEEVEEGNPFTPRPGEAWHTLVQGAYGIFQGAEHTRVTLRFTPYRARWIREQRWHPAQTLAEHPDGSLDLTFPVADLREVKMKVLSYGADVQVVEPEELRRLVGEEVGRMGKVYGKG